MSISNGNGYNFRMPTTHRLDVKSTAQGVYDRVQAGRDWLIIFNDDFAKQVVVMFQRWFFSKDRRGFDAFAVPLLINDTLPVVLTFLLIDKRVVTPEQMANFMRQASNTPVTTDSMRDQDCLFWCLDENDANQQGEIFQKFLAMRLD